ncbi:MAG: transcriptional regulator [Bacteroidia bacterium]|nr:transcriptional regulator [Bacteroidia bacterium]
MEKTNYILHLNKAFQLIYSDNRLSPFHVSLYYSLFQYWNISKFRNPISISRDDQMQASKIGSVNTYLRCLKELDTWGYIKYVPSHNPMKGSLVYMFKFDTTINTTTHTTSDNGNHNTSDKTTQTTLKKVLRPSINNSNSTNKLNSIKANASTRKKVDSKSFVTSSESQSKNKEKSCAKKESPTFLQVETYFTKNQWSAIEAQKFFNYYSSNGWLVGGKTPMKNWKACASNWMLNSEKFSNGKTNQSNSVTSSGVEKRPLAGNLHTSTDKNYSEPL